MKLTYEDKVQIYELRKQGVSYSKLSDMFDIQKSKLKYMIKLIDRYGLEIVKKGRNNYYSPELKQEMIDKVLHEVRSQGEVSLEYALLHRGLLPNWLAQYKKNKYTIVEKTRGRIPKMDKQLHFLSGGELKRLELARALLFEKPCLLVDEALSGLDYESSKILNDLIKTYSGAVIDIEHHISEEMMVGYDKIITIKDNHLVINKMLVE